MPLNPFSISEKARAYYGRAFPRIEIVAAHADENYRLPAGAREAISREIAKLPKKVAASASTIGNDGAQLRAAYEYLNGTNREEWEERMARDDATTRPLEKLLKDGITTWDQIKERVVAQQQKDGHARLPDDSPAEEEKEENISPQHEEMPSTAHPFAFLGALASASGTVLIELGRLIEEATHLHEVRVHNRQLQTHLDELEMKNQHLTERLTIQEETGRAMQRQLAGAEYHIQELNRQVKELAPQRLEELAELFPAIPQLFSCADEIRRQQRERKREEKLKELPRELLWESNLHGQPPETVSIIYAKPYNDSFLGFDEDAVRDKAIQMVYILCKEGPGFESFDTKYDLTPPPLHTPPEHAYSRVKDYVRVTWHKSGSELYFYNIFLRRDL